MVTREELNLEELAELPTKLRAYAERSAQLDSGLYTLLTRSARVHELARRELERDPPSLFDQIFGRHRLQR